MTRICTASRNADGCLRSVAFHLSLREGASCRSSHINGMSTA